MARYGRGQPHAPRLLPTQPIGQRSVALSAAWVSTSTWQAVSSEDDQLTAPWVSNSLWTATALVAQAAEAGSVSSSVWTATPSQADALIAASLSNSIWTAAAGRIVAASAAWQSTSIWTARARTNTRLPTDRQQWQAIVRDRQGNVVIEDLVLVAGTAQLRGLQKGLVPPSSTMPTATLRLMSATELEMLARVNGPLAEAIRADYALLHQNLRVELHWRGTRKPFNTYLLQIPQEDPDAYSWALVDTLQQLVEGHTEKQEFLTDTSSNIFKWALRDWALRYGDDFKTGDLVLTDGSALSYAQVSMTALTTAIITDSVAWTNGTVDGVAGTVISGMHPMVATYLHNRAHYLAPVYDEAYLEAVFVITADASAHKVGAGLIFGYDDGFNVAEGNRLVGEVILDVSAGAGQLSTVRVNINGGGHLFGDPPGPTTMSFDIPSAGDPIKGDGSLTKVCELKVYTRKEGFRLLFNGQEIPGAARVQASPFSAGSIGLYAANYGASNGGSVWATNLRMYDKQPLFLPGTVDPTTKVRNNGPYTEAALLDVIAIMAAQEDFDVRKNPRPGWGQDTVDYSASVGASTGLVFSNVVGHLTTPAAAGVSSVPVDTLSPAPAGTRLHISERTSANEWQREVITTAASFAGGTGSVSLSAPLANSYTRAAEVTWADCRILKGYPKNERNQQKLATELRVSGKSTGSAPPTYVAWDMAAEKKYGRISRAVSQPDVLDFDSLRKVGDVMMRLAASPGTGRTVMADMRGHEGEVTPLDTAIFDAPGMGLVMEERPVMGLDLTMGSPVAMLYLDQYPDHVALADYQRLQDQLTKLSSGGSQYTTPPGKAGIVQTSDAIVAVRKLPT